jgi:hypothetical protein
MKNIKIKLAIGKTVMLEAFHMSNTYAGMIVGKPSAEYNNEIIENISYPKDWGARKYYVAKSDIYLKEGVLKPIVYSAWLSAKSINDKERQFDGSSIVVIWLGDTIKSYTIEELIVFGLGKFDWDREAENYQL